MTDKTTHLIDDLKPFLKHHHFCKNVEYNRQDLCNCGLDDILFQLEHEIEKNMEEYWKNFLYGTKV